MKFLRYTWLLIALLCAKSNYAQVRISGTIGNSAVRVVGSIKAAIDSVNNGNFKGDINIDIIGNTTETVLSTLQASNVGNSNYSSIKIQPVGGSFVISGNLVSLIVFNGAKNVTIDGKMKNGDTLKFSNTTFSVFNFHSGASNNSIKNCVLLATSEFAIGFNVSSSGAACRNNSVLNCDIGPSTGILKNGILCQPTGSIFNSNFLIYNNRIYDVQLSAISLTKTTQSKIVKNKIFNKTTYLHNSSVSGGYNIKSILIADGGSHIVDSNIIGFQNSDGTGVMKILANSVNIAGFPESYTPTGTARSMSFTAIECAFSKDSSMSSVNGNLISNIAFYTGRNNTSFTKAFYGIRVLSGFASIGNEVPNIIGNSNTRGSIYVATSAVNTAVCGISLVTENESIIANNTIAGIDVSGTSSTSSGAFVGIFIQRSASTFKMPILILNNNIGSDLADNIRIGVLKTGSAYSSIGTNFLPSGSLGFAFGIHDRSNEEVTIGEQNRGNRIRNINLNVNNTISSLEVRMIGIFAQAPINKISHNDIYNLKTNGNNLSVSNTNVSAAGIILEQAFYAAIKEISYNKIYNIFSTYPNEAIANVGIGLNGQNPCLVKNNKIYNLIVSPSASYTPYIIGIYIPSVSNEVSLYNNMITLGVNINANANISGIWTGGSPSFRIYNNSVYIGGSSRKNYSICYQRGYFNTNSSTYVDIHNNIFVNNRRSHDTVDNFAISNNYRLSNVDVSKAWGEQFSNHNYFYARNLSKIGYWKGDKNFRAWISASNCDSQSVSMAMPNFIDTLNGNLGIIVDSLSYPLESAGIKIVNNTIDYNDSSRVNPVKVINNAGFSYDIGAVEIDAKYVDLIGPTIYYTHSNYQISTKTLRIDSVYIYDKSGINNNPGFKPRLYFKKSTDPNVFVSNSKLDAGWKYVEASNNTSPYSFNPDFNLLNGDTPTYNSFIQYFVVAQDLSTAGNVSFSKARPSNMPNSVQLQGTQFPILDSINSVKLCKTCMELSGNYLIGGSLNYPGLNTQFSCIYDFLNNLEPGKVRRIRILNKGAGYVNKPLISISGGGGTGATAVSILNKDSTIKEIVITNTGSGYTSKPTITISPVGIGGAGLLLDVDISTGAYFVGPTSLLLSSSYDNKYELDVTTASTFANGLKLVSYKNYGISAENNLTIKPAPNTNHYFKNYSNVNPHIFFRETEFITLDGSNNGSDSRNISFEYRKNASGSILMAYSTMFGRGNNHIVIKNCRVLRDTIFTGMTSLIGISIAGTNQTTTSIGYSNDYILLQNNEIYGCDIPIYLSGSSYRKDVGNIVKDNYLYNATFPNRLVGIFAGYQDKLLIEGNYIAGMRSDNQSIGISLGSQELGLNFTENLFSGSARISRNIISDNTSANNFMRVGIFASRTIQDEITIDNNIIYQTESISATKTSVGVFIQGNTGSKFNVYHNTIYSDGIKSSSAATTETSYNLAVTNHCQLDIRNNVFYNFVKSTSTRKAANIGLGFYNLNNGYKDLYSNHNLFYKSDSNSKLVYPYQLNSIGGVFLDSLNELRALTNQDQNSIFKKINYSIQAGIPRVDKSLACNFDNLVPAIPNYNLDVFKNLRKYANVDYGAEEYDFSFGVQYKLNVDSCNSQFVNLTEPSNFIGNINNLSIGYFEDSLASIPVVKPDSVSVSKTYYVRLNNANCSLLIPVKVQIVIPMYASISVVDTSVCSNDSSSSIIVTGVTNGTFSSDSGLILNSSTGEINPALSGIGRHIISYMYQSANNCYNFAYDTINIVQEIEAVISSNNGLIFCPGDSAILTAATNNSRLWSTGDTSKLIVVRTPGVYSLLISNGICIDTTSVTIQHFPNTILPITQNSDTLFTTPNLTNYKWFYNNNLIPSANSFFIPVNVSGSYKVTADDINKCNAFSNSYNYVFNSVNVNSREMLRIVPNPANAKINLLGKDYYDEIKIYSVHGAIIKEIHNSNGMELDINDLPAGIYLVYVDSSVLRFCKN